MCWNKITQDEFLKRIKSLNNGIVALDKYDGMGKKIKFQCKYGHIWEALPSNIIHKKRGCPYCSGRYAIIGETDMWTARPDVAKLLKNPEDGHKYTACSGQKTLFVCPDCGAEDMKIISNVSKQGMSCKVCSDGVSYPNKYGRVFLSQLPVKNLQYEYTTWWSENYLYDNYFEYNGQSYIVEMDGAQHYVDNKKGTWQDLESIRETDAIKDNLAKAHNIKMIRIDCMKSDSQYIKNSILNSELNILFDLSLINWELCDAIAQNNLVKEASKLYDSGVHDVEAIRELLHIGSTTVRRYLWAGTRLGWCKYSPEESKKIAGTKIRVPVVVVDDDNNVIYSFDGVTSCIAEMTEMFGVEFNSSGIRLSCTQHKPYKGFNFRYSVDFMNICRDQYIEHLIDTSPLDYSDEDDFYWIEI